MDLGDLKEIEIGHDGKGLAAGWHLQLVAVTNEATGLYTAFPCDRWLDRGEEDGQTVVRLSPTGPVRSRSLGRRVPSGIRPSTIAWRSASPRRA